MGIFLHKAVGKNGKLGIWQITESLDELLKMIPMSAGTEKDLSVLDSNSNERRKKEWLVARILAEQLTDEKDSRIIYDEHKKPFLSRRDGNPENSKKHISLSHSHNLLAVIIDEQETGIDIEVIKPKVVRIKEKFMSEEELGSLQKEKQEEQLTTYWCAKESLYKLYGRNELVFNKHLIIEPFQYSEKGVIRGWIKNSAKEKLFTLQYQKIISGNDNYMLTHIINQD